MTSPKDKLDVLVKDLVRLGDHSRWEPPKQKENIDWFNKYGNGISNHFYQSDSIVIKRLESLVAEGADLTNHAYLFANINSPEIIKAALRLGANPNIPGKAKLLAIERAFYKGRTSVAEVLINDPNFDFNQRGRDGKNVLFMAVSTGKYKLANNIFALKPELSLERDMDNSNIMLCLAEYLSKDKKINSKIIKFINSCMDYALKNNIYFSCTETNNKNKSVSSTYHELAEIITEKQALDLANKLSKNDDEKKRKSFKI